MSQKQQIQTETLCYHCGEPCREVTIASHNHEFCCEGCKLVYEILSENDLTNYYRLNSCPAPSARERRYGERYDYLDDDKVRQKLISFTDGKTAQVTFFIPHIHCSSCIWLLEHLYKLDIGIKRSTVNFLRREVSLVFDENETSLQRVAILLDKLGYAPHISLEDFEGARKTVSNRQAYYKLGVAFFCFGNIMLLSFPEYFGLDTIRGEGFRNLFGYLNILLSLPVLLYADTGFFRSALNGLRQGRLNMDFPISLGIVVMYGRSLYEILSGTGAGYMDTFAGLIFFMLTGRMFQDKSYQRLSFERDYKSYFPIAVTALVQGEEKSIPLSELKPGTHIRVRNEELIPADSILLRGVAAIDYSFVTGEQEPVPIQSGERIYAGGKQVGASIELEVVNEVSQSRLTQLWNESELYQSDAKDFNSIVDKVSRIFTLVVILIALSAGSWYVYQNQLPTALNAFTAVLIITCPCALALSYPFALGNSIRIFGKNRLFLKNTKVIEKISRIDRVVFDKTGTITINGGAEINYHGEALEPFDRSAILSLASQSGHPLSKMLAKHLRDASQSHVQSYVETPGKGISGIFKNDSYSIGSAEFIGPSAQSMEESSQTRVYWSKNKEVKGYFAMNNVYRDGIQDVITGLQKRGMRLSLVSGDNDSEKLNLQGYFLNGDDLYFKQSPAEKLSLVKSWQNSVDKVMMVGDGLNDAGALMQSDCGITVSDDINNFSPACDGILDSKSFRLIPRFLDFARRSMYVIYISYAISLIYNCFGVWLAIKGDLSPLFAAIIMPLSTVTIILFTTLGSGWMARRSGLKA